MNSDKFLLYKNYDEKYLLKKLEMSLRKTTEMFLKTNRNISEYSPALDRYILY